MNRLHFIFRTLLVTALIGAFSGITAQDTLLSQKTTFICETCHPADALDSLFRMKEIDHAYSRDDFRNKKVRNFNFTKPVPLSQVLDSILSGCDLTYKTKKKKVSIFKTQPKNCSIHFIDSRSEFYEPDHRACLASMERNWST